MVLGTGSSRFANLVQDLEQATDAHSLTRAVGALAATGDCRAVEPLLTLLGDRAVQDDPQVETAFCEALVELGAMHRTTNSSYVFLSRDRLASEQAATIGRLDNTIPLRYLIGHG
jgi:hypothetical protein